MKTPYLVAAGVGALGLAAVAVVALTSGGDDPFAPCRNGVVAGGSASIGGPFELVSETGETVTSDEALDRPSLVYFGYTFCPDVCPFDNARNAEAVDLLAEEGFDVQPVFITVDGARDTPEVLREYTDYMHPDMLGLTGSDAQIKQAADAYRVYYDRTGDDDDAYLMNHTTFTYLMLPDRGFVEFFRGAPGASGEGVEAPELAERAACFLKRA